MDKLEALSSITRLSERAVRVLGQNPGKFTLQGTNTYIVGSRNPYILIDTGEGREEYGPVLESALRGTSKAQVPSEPDVSDIVLSHWHHDHVGGLPQVLALLSRLWADRNTDVPFKPPRLHKFPLPDDPNADPRSDITSFLRNIPTKLYTPAPDGSILHSLFDGQTLLSPSASLRIIYSPGHTADSISLLIPEDNALYTADTVLGQGTAVFEDLGKYVRSLRKMLSYVDESSSPDQSIQLYPGHGPVVSEGKKTIQMYISHRLEREAQIVNLLRTAPPDHDEYWTTWTLVKSIYASYPDNLWLPAAHGVNLHLSKLKEDGVVEKIDGKDVDSRWKIVG